MSESSEDLQGRTHRERMGPVRHYNFLQNWQDKARENVEKWGLQDRRTLVLAMLEELGELTQAVLEHEAEDGDYQRMYDETADLGALLIQMEHALEQGHSEANKERLEQWMESDSDA